MKMKRLLSFMLLLLIVGSVNAEIAYGPWKFPEPSSSWVNGRGTYWNATITTLSGNHVTSVRGMTGTDVPMIKNPSPHNDDRLSFFTGATSDGMGFRYLGPATQSHQLMVFSGYYHDEVVPSYTKVVMTWKYTLRSYSAVANQMVALYCFDNTTDDAVLKTQLDGTYHNNNNSYGEPNRIAKIVHNTANGANQTLTQTNTFEFDNRAGNSLVKKRKWLIMTHVAGWGGNTERADFRAFFYNNDLKYDYYYYKYITFNANNGAGSMAQQTVENSATLNANTFTKTGYHFTGWKTAANGSGTTYADRANITATSDSKGPVTLYAQWAPNNYSVNFDANGGECTTNSQSVTYNTKYGTLPIPTRFGYRFDGWYTAKVGGNKVEATTTYTTASNTTLYAQWTPDDIDVTANSNPESPADFYSTFYFSEMAYQLPAGVKAYTATINGDEIRLAETTNGIVPKGEAVILKGTGNTIQLTPLPNDSHVKNNANVLDGVDNATSQDGNYKYYMLSYGQNGLGFYLMNSGTTLAAHKAFIKQPKPAAGNARAFRMVFVEDDATGIDNVNDNDDDTLSYDDIYSISGVRQNKLQKGINIVNGKKIVVK